MTKITSQYVIDRKYQVADPHNRGTVFDLNSERYERAKERKNPAIAHHEACIIITAWNDEFKATSNDREFGLDRIYGKDLLLKKIALYMKYNDTGKWVQMTNYKEPWDLLEGLIIFESGMRMITPNYFTNNKGGK